MGHHHLHRYLKVPLSDFDPLGGGFLQGSAVLVDEVWLVVGDAFMD